MERELDESPLKTFTRNQAEGALCTTLGAQDELVVDWAISYGQPALGDKLKEMKEKGCERILLFPLYPQYAGATTATALDEAYARLKTMRWQPAIRTVPPYYAQPAYIKAVASSLKAYMKQLSWKPDKILIAFHGLPCDISTRAILIIATARNRPA